MYRVSGKFLIVGTGAGSPNNNFPNPRTGVRGMFTDSSGKGATSSSVSVGDYLYVLLADQTVWRWRITEITDTADHGSYNLEISISHAGETTNFPVAYQSTPIPAGSQIICGAITDNGPSIVPNATIQGASSLFTAGISSLNDAEEVGGVTEEQATTLTYFSAVAPSGYPTAMALYIGNPTAGVMETPGYNDGMIIGGDASQLSTIAGVSSHRWMFGGYDNYIGAAISCYLFGSNHNVVMPSGSGHSFISGGACNTLLTHAGESACPIGCGGVVLGQEYVHAVCSRQSSSVNSPFSGLDGAYQCSIGMHPSSTVKGLITASTVTNGNPQNNEMLTVDGEVFGAVGDRVTLVILDDSTGATWSPTPIEAQITAVSSGETQFATTWPDRGTNGYAPTIVPNTSYAAISDAGYILVENGTATGAPQTTGTLKDTSKSWTTNQHAGRRLWLNGGTLDNQRLIISSNTSDTLSVQGTWTVAPTAGVTKYRIEKTDVFNSLVGYNSVRDSLDSHVECGAVNDIRGYQCRATTHTVYTTSVCANFTQSFGRNTRTTGVYQSAWGNGVRPFNSGSRVWSSGYHTSAGDMQWTHLHLYNATTNATPVVLQVQNGAFTGWSGANGFLPPSKTFGIKGEVVARKSGGGDNACWNIHAMITTSAQVPYGHITVVSLDKGTPIKSGGASSWDIDLTTDVDIFSLSVTGQTATNIKWTAFLELTELAY